ncbi:hypothetical protein [Cysteiniphilum sp. QT6929]|uniref:hypothetical protein n=1 Tax=Cysteiniphilum sp. QT6929 TaxID=2975055 RepID=UPI0024B3C792|nr:hypothetical protein [Cysteiniphilum sp. QT6929]WHN66481.1 hypothetical protein NYP54_04440 [Cysteiniphilum sp. QT6929]
MKNIITLALLTASALTSFANTSQDPNQEPVLAKVSTIEVFKGNVDKETPDRTINTYTAPGFEKCAVYLKSGEESAKMLITLSRTGNEEGAKYLLQCEPVHNNTKM